MCEKKLSIRANILYNSFGSLFYLGCQWLVTILVVRLGSYESGGVLTRCIAVTNVLFTVSTFGLRTYQISDVRHHYLHSDYVSTRLLTMLLSLILCGVYTFGAMDGAEPQARLCMMLYMFFKLTESLSDVMQAIVQQADRMDYIFKGMLMRGVVTLGLFAVMMKWTASLPAAILFMALGAYTVILIYEVPNAKKQAAFNPKPNAKRSLALLKTCWPLMLTSFFANAVISIPRTTLGTVMGNEALGFYGAIATPAVLVQTGSLLLFAPMVTTLSRAYDNRDKQRYFHLLGKVLSLLIVFTILMLAAAYFEGEWGLALIFGNVIRPYASLLPPVLLTAFFIAVNQFLTELLTISRKLKAVMAVNITATLASFLLAGPMILSFGINGVNVALIAALSMGIVLKAICLTRVFKKQFQKEAAS